MLSPPRERAEAFQAAVSGASSSNLATFDDPANVRALLDLPALPLVRDHILNLTTHAEELSADPAAGRVGAATVELMRAGIVSAAQDERLANDTMATSLVPRILAYVRYHLSEADLEPARIAAAHNISTR
jgi:imidazolonepropionase-like amidohydrolase